MSRRTRWNNIEATLIRFRVLFFTSSSVSCSSARAGWALTWRRLVSATPSRSRHPAASRPSSSRPPQAASPRRRGRQGQGVLAPRAGAAAPPSLPSPTRSSPCPCTTCDKIPREATRRFQVYIFSAWGELERLYSSRAPVSWTYGSICQYCLMAWKSWDPFC